MGIHVPLLKNNTVRRDRKIQSLHAFLIGSSISKLTVSLKFFISATGKAVSPPSSTSFR